MDVQEKGLTYTDLALFKDSHRPSCATYFSYSSLRHSWRLPN